MHAHAFGYCFDVIDTSIEYNAGKLMFNHITDLNQFMHNRQILRSLRHISHPWPSAASTRPELLPTETTN